MNFDDYLDPEKNYTDLELEEIADLILKAHSQETLEDGRKRGIGGENPILFAEHIYARRRREIYPVNGTPDPSLVAGIYNRTHPDGRKTNSEEARKKNGASYFKG